MIIGGNPGMSGGIETSGGFGVVVVVGSGGRFVGPGTGATGGGVPPVGGAIGPVGAAVSTPDDGGAEVTGAGDLVGADEGGEGVIGGRTAWGESGSRT